MLALRYFKYLFSLNVFIYLHRYHMISPDGSVQKIASCKEDGTVIQPYWKARCPWWYWWEMSPLILIHLSTFLFFTLWFLIWVMFLLLHCAPQSHITGVSSHDFLFVYHILASSSASLCCLLSRPRHRGKTPSLRTTECRVHSQTDKAPPFLYSV